MDSFGAPKGVAPYQVRIDAPRTPVFNVSASSHAEAAEIATREAWDQCGVRAPAIARVRYVGHDPSREVVFEVYAAIAATAALVLDERQALREVLVLTTSISRAMDFLRVEAGVERVRDPRLVYIERPDQLRGRAGAVVLPLIDYEDFGDWRTAQALRAMLRSRRDLVQTSLDEVRRVIGGGE